MENPLHRVRIAGHGAEPVVPEGEAHASPVGQRGTRRHHRPGGLGGIRAAAGQAGLVARGGQERLDDPRELGGVAEHGLERAPVLPGRSGPAQGELGLGLHARQRRAQLVGELGGQPLLLADGRRDPAQQGVEGGGEGRDLVPGRAGREAPVEIGRAPGHGVPGHASHRPQRQAEKPVDEQRDEGEHGHAQSDRRPERRARGLLVGDERDGAHDGAHGAAAGRHGQGYQARVGARDLDRPRAAGGERGRSPLGRRRSARVLERPAAAEHPHGRVEGCVVRRLGHLQAPALHRQRAQPGGGAGAGHVAGLRVQAALEQHVEHHHEHGQGHAQAGHGGQEEPPPQGARPYRGHDRSR
jgi:hypothetical protein